MRLLSRAVLAACLISAARAADVTAPVIPSGPVPISAPVLSALSSQLSDLSGLKNEPPTTVALRLAGLARTQSSQTATSSAASAVLIKQALTDPGALKTLLASLQQSGEQGAAAGHALAELRESMYAGSSPEKIRASLQWTMGPFEEKLKAGKTLNFADLAKFYDGSAASAAQTGVLAAEQSRAGENGKLNVPLQPASRSPESPSAPGPLPPDGVVLENEKDASPTALKALHDAVARVGSLPQGVTMIVRSGKIWGDNPQILIYVDGRSVYYDYLYHAEADLGRTRLSLNPASWLGWLTSRGKPSDDLSKRFEAALRMAQEARIRAPRQPAGDDWLLKP